jgi:hypothetical protein
MKLTSTISPASDISLRHLADAAQVLHAILVGEAQVAIEPVAHVVAIQHERVQAHGVQALVDEVGDGGLARADRPVNHTQRGACPGCARARPGPRPCAANAGCRRGATRKSTVPAATVALSMRSIRMKPPNARLSRVGLERDRLVQREVAVPTSLSARCVAASCACVSMSTLCLSAVTVAPTVRVPSFNQ